MKFTKLIRIPVMKVQIKIVLKVFWYILHFNKLKTELFSFLFEVMTKNLLQIQNAQIFSLTFPLALMKSKTFPLAGGAKKIRKNIYPCKKYAGKPHN